MIFCSFAAYIGLKFYGLAEVFYFYFLFDIGIILFHSIIDTHGSLSTLRWHKKRI